MAWYIQLSIFLFAISVAFITLWQVDFNKFMRIGRKQFSILVYVVLSLALGYLLGKIFIEIASLLNNIT